MTNQDKLYVNVASSYLVLEEFLNLDNHPFLRLLSLYPFLKYVLAPGHREMMDKLREAKSRAVLKRHDCRHRLPFRDNSVDHILCSHFLEHVYPDEARAIVQGFYRVLKPGGTLHVIVPDLATIVEDYRAGQYDVTAVDNFFRESNLSQNVRPSLKFRFLEFIGSFGLYHRWMYDDVSMRHLLTSVGFVVLDNNTTPSAKFRNSDRKERDGSVNLVVQKPL